MVDFSGEFGQRAKQRLRNEQVIWLTTTSADGTPQPSPVWFLWDGETILIFSEPKAPKIANIRRAGRVALHLNTDADGEDVVVLLGEATVVSTDPPAAIPAEYAAKYAGGMESLKLTAEQMAGQYSATIRVTPTKLRGH